MRPAQELAHRHSLCTARPPEPHSLACLDATRAVEDARVELLGELLEEAACGHICNLDYLRGRIEEARTK